MIRSQPQISADINGIEVPNNSATPGRSYSYSLAIDEEFVAGVCRAVYDGLGGQGFYVQSPRKANDATRRVLIS